MGGISVANVMNGYGDDNGDDYFNSLLEELIADPCRDDDEEEDEEEQGRGEEDKSTTILGTAFHGPTFDENYNQDDLDVGTVTDAWPHRKVSNFIWMNNPAHKEFAHASLAVRSLLLQKHQWRSRLNLGFGMATKQS